MNNKYIIKSNSHIIITNEINKITESIDNITYFSMNDTELDDIIVDASYFGFLDTTKAIVITDINYFGDKFKHEPYKYYKDNGRLYLSYITMYVLNKQLGNRLPDLVKKYLAKEKRFSSYSYTDTEADNIVGCLSF